MNTPGKQARAALRTGLLFIAPWIAGFAVFIVYPFAMSVYYSLCHYNVFEPPRFIGLYNYAALARDRVFWISLGNTLYYAGLSIPLGTALSIGLALLLNADVRGRALYRVVFYLPTLIPLVAVAILWLWIFNGEFGLLNLLLRALGVARPPNWLADPAYAKLAIVLMSLWTVGQAVVIYLAALQDVPTALLEAAELDGAPWHAKIRHIVLPFMSPAILFNVVMSIIGAFQVFAVPYIMTKGGPGRATTFYTMYLYQKAFEDFDMGYAAAMAWFLFLLIVALTLLVFRIARSKVFYAE